MPREPSDKTKLARVRRQLTDRQQELNEARIDCSLYRSRATKAEQEVAEWKQRFDKLLDFRKALDPTQGKRADEVKP